MTGVLRRMKMTTLIKIMIMTISVVKLSQTYKMDNLRIDVMI